MINPKTLQEITTIAETLQKKHRNLKVCGHVAEAIHHQLGIQAIAGSYSGLDDDYALAAHDIDCPNDPAVEPASSCQSKRDASVRHCWNILDDGTIVDATANQFEHADSELMPRIVRPNDPQYSNYHECARFVPRKSQNKGIRFQ